MMSSGWLDHHPLRRFPGSFVADEEETVTERKSARLQLR